MEFPSLALLDDIPGFQPGALELIRALYYSGPPNAGRGLLLPHRDMASNPMNGFDLDYPVSNRDDSQDARDDILQASFPSHDPALMDFPNSYAFNAMLPHEGDLPLQSFDRPAQQPGDLEGRLSNVMLTYDSIPSTGASMPMGLDTGSTFTYDVPTPYPATSMGLATPDQSQLQPIFPPFAQPLPPTGQYLQPQQNPSQTRQDTYNTATGPMGSFENSDFSRAGDQSQVQTSRPSQRFPQYKQPASYRALQPVRIQPKRPVTVKGESFCVRKLTR